MKHPVQKTNEIYLANEEVLLVKSVLCISQCLTTVNLGYYFCKTLFSSCVTPTLYFLQVVAQGLWDIYTYSTLRQWGTLNSNSVEICYIRKNIAYSTVTHGDKTKHATGTRICISQFRIVTDIAGSLIRRLSYVTLLKVICAQDRYCLDCGIADPSCWCLTLKMCKQFNCFRSKYLLEYKKRWFVFFMLICVCFLVNDCEVRTCIKSMNFEQRSNNICPLSS